MGATMRTALAPPPGVLSVVADEVSIARLHGEACWFCGAVHCPLRAVGSVATAVEGGFRVWTVFACPDDGHREVR